jgi:hypothetical protein
MRRLLLGTALLALSLGASADQSVNGYTRQDGTYVAPYMRSEPNSTSSDNYSTRGNTNPYTGERGSRSDDDGYRSNDGWSSHRSRSGW